MNKPSEHDWDDLRREVLGLGKESARKSHYPSLRQRLLELDRFRSVVDLASDLLFVVDLDSGAILDVNGTACRRLSRTRDEFTATRFDALLPAAASAAIVRLFSDFRNSARDSEILVSRLEYGSGESFPAEIAVRCGTADGRAYAVLAARDISERERAEAALRESEERYRRFVRMSAEGMCRFDFTPPVPTGLEEEALVKWFLGAARLNECNDAFARQHGAARPDDLLGARFESVWRGASGEAAEAVRKFARADFLFTDLEAREMDHRNNPVWSLNNGVGIVEREHLTSFWLTQRDITARRLLEEDLRQAQKMEAIGLLAGGVAHDFNNLLTVINGYSDLALERSLPEDPVRDMIAQVREAGERATEVTGQLLAFGRRQMLQPEVLDLNAVVRDGEKLLRRLIGEEIELVCVLEPQVLLVEADPSQLQRVIINLAVNARDAMPRGGTLTLETGTGTFAGGRRCAVLSVRDTGCGMDEATRSRIFEPFFTTKAAGRGTGLGLATVYGVVKQSGGDVEVSSEPGRGTTFRVSLPFSSQPVARKAPETAVAARGSETVLLVEDRADVRRLMADSLRSLGYSVLDAPDPEAALDLARKHTGPLDVLVTDVVMPGMRGPELAVEVERLRPAVKTLLVSGHLDPSLLHEGGGRSASWAFLQKPFTASTLAAAVRQVLAGEPGLAASS